MHGIFLACHVLWSLPFGPLAAFPPLPPEALKQAGLPADGASMLVFLRGRMLAPGDAEHLAGLVQQLSDRNFATRQKATTALVTAGPKAAPFLRRALADSDAEVRRRAQTCLQALERHTAVLPLAVQRLVQERPGQEIPVLLGLAAIADEALEEAVLSALAILAIQRGPDAALQAALSAEDPQQRAAAALTLCRCGLRFRDPLRPLVNDADARVRYAAALGLLANGERRAATTLAALLDHSDVTLARRGEMLLRSLAGAGGPALADKPSPAARREVWDGWCRLHAGSLDLSVIEDYLPPIHLPGRLRVFARHALEALGAGNGAATKSIVGQSILFGTQQHNSVEWIEARLSAAPSAAYFRGLKVVPLGSYLPWARSPRELDFHEQIKAKDGWAVFYAPNPDSWGVVFVKRQDHRLVFAGVSIDRAGKPE